MLYLVLHYYILGNIGSISFLTTVYILYLFLIKIRMLFPSHQNSENIELI